MTLRQKQSEFVKCVVLLLVYAHSLGYEITFGDAYRDPRVKYGHPRSTHRKRLAIDLNLFIKGAYQTGKRGHDKLGAFWVKLNPLARWGGSFGDYNHYSFKHNGVK
jgi:hypothetical protein